MTNKYRIKIILEGLPKGANGAQGAYMAAAAIKKRWRTNAAWAAKSQPKPAEPLKSYALTCTRHSTSEMDFDNLVISFKNILDGLKDAGIIYDDSPKYARHREYKQEKAKAGKGFVTVEVRELDADDLSRCLYCGK